VPKAPPIKWTREHFLIALNLYHKLEFGKLHERNPLIIDVARKMGRTPGSLAMKLCNFASLDPVLQDRGIRGLPGATKLDRAVWAEFRQDYQNLAPTSEELLHNLFTSEDDKEVDFLQRDRIRLERPRFKQPFGPTEKQQLVKVRRGQQFFRQTILNAYDIRCAISGINIPTLLVASHIKPWSQFPEERLNPRNGLCLSAIHDAAFDAGLITFDKNWNLKLSSALASYFPNPSLEQNFFVYENKSLRLPIQIAEPSQEFLEFHRNSIFQKSS
jgi:putative restriction endonuclease